jgi:hypothetical protein
MLSALPLPAATLGYVLLGLAAAIFALGVILFAAYRRRTSSATPQVPQEREEAPQREPPARTAGGEGLDSVTSLSTRLSQAEHPESIARVLLHEVVTLLKVEFAALALISEDGKEAKGLYARGEDGDVGWWTSVTIDLENEPSAIASCVFEAAPLTIYDVESSSTGGSPSASAPRARPSSPWSQAKA